MRNKSCDIFCNVIDNYGDIGVCWRLARQLAHEQGIAVRLWVDDLSSFHRLCFEVDAAQEQQVCLGVEVRHWTDFFPRVEPAHLIIEAFACQLPTSYIEAMAAQTRQPVWINLEHLSAEDWVAGCHGLPSPHPSLPLTKYFFFPGFTPDTGGLLLEDDLMARRDAFQLEPLQQQAFWQSVGVEMPSSHTLKISLFCYENPAIGAMLSTWSQSAIPILCLMPESRALPQVAGFFGLSQVLSGKTYIKGRLQLRVLPFMEQQRYDELLWACDINFVRGEDSFVRAQWAGKPFVWHIYPQQDEVHIEKLRAFLQLLCAGLPSDVAHAMQNFSIAWNAGSSSEQPALSSSEQVWNDFLTHESVLRQHAQTWARHLSSNRLVLNVLNFYRKIDRMRDL